MFIFAKATFSPYVRVLIAALAAIVLPTALVRAQCPETWSSLGNGTNGSVTALEVLPDGDLLVGGDFTVASGVNSSIARVNPITGVWSSIGGTNGSVWSFAKLSNGDLIAGGWFTSIGGVAANRIARYNPTTGVWSALGSGTNDAVRAITVLPNGDVIAVGDFTMAGGIAANRIARYNLNSGGWSALGSGTNNICYGVAALPGGDIIVGGDFTTAGGVTVNRIARVNPTTNVWSTMGSGVDARVRVIRLLPGGDVMVGGLFSSAGGVAATGGVARYSPSTNLWSPVAAGSGPSGGVRALAVAPNGDVIVSGQFAFIATGGATANNIARLNSSTGTWSALGGGTTGGVVWSLAVLPSGDVIAGGDISSAGGTAVSNIARVNPATGIWSALGNGTNDTITSLAVLPGGDLVVGGFFGSAGGTPANHIARYNPATGVWSAMGSGTSGLIFALAVLPGGDLIAGGGFTTAGGASANSIARYNPSTGAWSALGFGAVAGVNALAVLPGGDLIVGGSFTTVGPLVSANRIARYNPSTGVWSALGSGIAGDIGIVDTLIVLPGGDVLVGGRFTTAGGVLVNNIARYNPTTGVWSALGNGTNGPVFAQTVLPGGDVIVGGSFTTVGPLVSANRIARYNPSTGVWSALGSGTSDWVNALAVLPDGDVIVGGRFTSASGVPGCSGVARYNPTTGVWSAPSTGVQGVGVNALAVLPGGDVIVAGRFTSAGGVAANNIARYDIESAAVDGTRDCFYPPPLHVQAVNTQFGDALTGAVDYANGSELNSLSARVRGNILYLHLAGNLESNFNKLEIFFDSVPGGQNSLRADNPSVDSNGLNRMGASGTFPGLTFDAGFNADRYITLTCGGSPFALYATYAEILTNGGGTGGFLGSTEAAGNGTLSTGNNPFGIRAAIDNSNTSGVIAGPGAANSVSAAAVDTGIELAIPLPALGLAHPCGSVKVCTFINSVQHDFLSNQVLGSLPVGSGNLAGPRIVNFSTIAGSQFVEITLGGSVPSIGTQPGVVTACPSGSATFAVTASGTGPFTHQWRKSGVAINTTTNPSAATAVLNLDNVQIGDAGSYDCVVTNPCGSVTSNTAILTLLDSCCDSIDFNQNTVFPEEQDVIDFFTVLAGGECSPGNICNDIDFNNNSVFPEEQDVIDFFNVLAGGTCP